MLTELIDRSCDSVEKHEASWAFGFGEGCGLSVECPWRLIMDGQTAIADGDVGQTYGLAEPIDAAQETRSLLAGKRIIDAKATGAGDLTIVFEDGLRLEVFNNSSGYEAWVLSTSSFTMVGRNG